MMRIEGEYEHIVTTYSVTRNRIDLELHATCNCRWHAIVNPADPLLLAEAVAEHLDRAEGA
jgi:hypothetical protein